jgi:phage FluMu gp28-like protein
LTDTEVLAPKISFPAPGTHVPPWRPKMEKLRPVWRQAVPDRELRWMLDPVWFWSWFGTYEDEPIVFDPWQVADLRDYSRIRFREKAPQIGFSWLRACEAVWQSIMFVDSLTGFVSVNQDEASEKVLYALKLYDGLPDLLKKWVPLPVQNKDELWFGDSIRPSRIMSIPATAALRGRRMDQVVLDESDFYKDGGHDMYRVAIGRVGRSGGRVSLGSTAYGLDTMLDRGMQGLGEDGKTDDRMRVISKARYPWPVAENPETLAGIELARSTLGEDAFAEEYECRRGGLGGSPFPSQLIQRQTHQQAQVAVIDGNDTEGPEIVWSPSGLLAGGFDVGKSRNPSVLSLFEKVPGEPWREIGLIELRRPDGQHYQLVDQQRWLARWLREWPMLNLAVDSKGIGAQLAQGLEKEFGTRRVTAMELPSKPDNRLEQNWRSIITESKRQLESKECELVPNMKRARQFTRTARKPNGDYEQPLLDKDDHYDLFWATAYAQYLMSDYGRLRSVYNERPLAVVGGYR